MSKITKGKYNSILKAVKPDTIFSRFNKMNDKIHVMQSTRVQRTAFPKIPFEVTNFKIRSGNCKRYYMLVRVLNDDYNSEWMIIDKEQYDDEGLYVDASQELIDFINS